MKRHYWQYLIDSAGNAVEGAKINVYLAGTLTYVNIYTSETGTPITTEFTDILTNSDGMFDFWIADLTSSPVYGYPHTQRFKITWSKPGMVTGGMDNIDILFPSTGTLEEGNLNETLSVAASATEEFELSGFCNRCLVYECVITPTPSGNFDLEIYKDDTFTDLQYKVENVITGLTDTLPFYLKDYNSEEKLYVKVINYSNAVSINLELNYEKFA